MVRAITSRLSYPRFSFGAGDWTRWAIVAALTWAISPTGCGRSTPPTLDPAKTLQTAQDADLIAVNEDQPWLLAVACPVVSRVRHGEQLPWLLAVAAPPAKEVVRLVDRLAPQRMLLLSGQANTELQRAFAGRTVDLMDIGTRPASASLQVARRFWGKSPEVVGASIEEPEAMLWGSLLAARRGEPLLLLDPQDPDPTQLAQTLRQLRVARVLAIARKDGASWPASIPAAVERLDPEAVQRRLLAGANRAAATTIVVARIPDEKHGVGKTAWLAPYMGLVRGAPLVLCDSPSAEEVERAVGRLVRDDGLQPRSVTILADDHSIGTHPIRVPSDDDPNEARYKVRTEPCMPMTFEQLVSVGVGRIPFASLQEASALYVRGLARARLLVGKEPRALMISNPALNNMELPLCEAISRLTVAELRNFGVHVDEFYRAPANHPEVMDLATEAGMIIYEGHTEHDGLLRDPAYEYSRETIALRIEANGKLSARTSAAPAGGAASRRFDGLPVVVLQTCDSLQSDMLWRVHGAGGVALLGSSTPIHSASGSGFAKAVYDAVLYRGATLGEALRDAQNYFFCLQDLKDLRHHRERAKSQRVALSFRLWGDPELRVLPDSLGPPRLAPVAARWQAPAQIAVEIPGQRFAEVRNEAYVAQFFPGSEAAGMVLRLKDESARKVSPVYFFRLPLPGPLRVDPPVALFATGNASDRTVFRVDPAGRFLYVLYLPEKETAHEIIALRWTKKPPADAQ